MKINVTWTTKPTIEVQKHSNKQEWDQGTPNVHIILSSKSKNKYLYEKRSTKVYYKFQNILL